jgi:hypothetical protein
MAVQESARNSWGIAPDSHPCRAWEWHKTLSAGRRALKRPGEIPPRQFTSMAIATAYSRHGWLCRMRYLAAEGCGGSRSPALNEITG